MTRVDALNVKDLSFSENRKMKRPLPLNEAVFFAVSFYFCG